MLPFFFFFIEVRKESYKCSWTFPSISFSSQTVPEWLCKLFHKAFLNEFIWQGALLPTSLLSVCVALPDHNTVKVQHSVLFGQVWHTTAGGYMIVFWNFETLPTETHARWELSSNGRGNIRGKLFSDWMRVQWEFTIHVRLYAAIWSQKDRSLSESDIKVSR